MTYPLLVDLQVEFQSRKHSKDIFHKARNISKLDWLSKLCILVESHLVSQVVELLIICVKDAGMSYCEDTSWTNSKSTPIRQIRPEL